MKPRADLSHSASASDDLHVEDDTFDPPSKPAARRPRAVHRPSAVDAACLSLIGLVALACGLALTVGPRFSWKLSELSDGFKGVGVDGGALAIGGIVILALGLLRRGQHTLRTPTAEQEEDRQLIEQLTRDSLRAAEVLARLESGLAHLESELASSRRTVEERFSRIAGEVVAMIPPPPPPSNPDDAIFRLAASLDQTGMKIEQRLKTQFTALQDHLEDVGSAILAARNTIQGMSRSGEDHAATLRDEVQAQVDSALHDTSFRPEGHAPAARSLGVLDTIEEHSGHAGARLADVGSALPMHPEEAREQGAGAGGPLGILSQDFDTRTRLIQLSALLADPKLRQALEGLQRS